MTSVAAQHFDPDAVTPGSVARIDVGFTDAADGRASSFPLVAVAGRHPGPTLLCVGGIHGDEYEGPSALWRLADWINPDTLAGRVWIVPIANVAAFDAGLRTSPIDGHNLARIFPGDASGTHSFRLAHALFALARRADLLFDCHSGGVRLAFLPVAGFYPADQSVDPAVSRRSLELAKAARLPHLWQMPARAGVLSFEAMRCGVAVVGAEIGGRGGLLDTDSDLYLRGIQGVMASERMLPLVESAPIPPYRTFLDGDWEVAPSAGFLDNHVALGDVVEPDALLATIRSPSGAIRHEMRAGAAGVVMGVRHLRSIQVGEWATCVVREVPF